MYQFGFIVVFMCLCVSCYIVAHLPCAKRTCRSCGESVASIENQNKANEVEMPLSGNNSDTNEHKFEFEIDVCE